MNCADTSFDNKAKQKLLMNFPSISGFLYW